MLLNILFVRLTPWCWLDRRSFSEAGLPEIADYVCVLHQTLSRAKNRVVDAQCSTSTLILDLSLVARLPDHEVYTWYVR